MIEIKYQYLINTNQWDYFDTHKCNWTKISKSAVLPSKFIERFAHKIKWDIIVLHQKLPLRLIKKFIKEIIRSATLDNLIRYQGMSYKFFDSFIVKLKEFKTAEKYYINSFIENKVIGYIPVQFIKKYLKYIKWSIISQYVNLDGKFIEKYHHKLNWDYVSQYQNISSYFVLKYNRIINWNHIFLHHEKNRKFLISLHHKFVDSRTCPYINETTNRIFEKIIAKKRPLHYLSEDYIINNIDKTVLAQYDFREYLRCSIQFCKKFYDIIPWPRLAKHIRLPEHIIEEFFDELDINDIVKYQYISKEFIEKHKIGLPSNSWLRKSPDTKLKLAIKQGYENHGDYIYGSINMQISNVLYKWAPERVGLSFDAIASNHIEYNLGQRTKVDGMPIYFDKGSSEFASAGYHTFRAYDRVRIHKNDIAIIVDERLYARKFTVIR